MIQTRGMLTTCTFPGCDDRFVYDWWVDGVHHARCSTHLAGNLSPRTREVIAETAAHHSDDDEDAALMAERLSRAVARRIRRNAEAMKKCPACEEAKTVESFAKDRRAPDGLFWRCRVCDRSARAGNVRSTGT